MSLLSTGISALNTAQLGLATTQHNIANVNTAGYSRQSTMQVTNFAMMTGAGAIGQGVHVQTILRSYSDILTKQVQEAQTRSSELDTYYSMISRIDNLLADANSGLTPVMASFFQSVQDVAANPNLVSARQAMVSAGQSLATRFQTLDNRLTQLYEETNSQIKGSVEQINAYSAQIAKLNEKIIAQHSTGHPPNDLLDERDQLVLELNKLVQVNTSMNDDYSLNVYAGSGQQLVIGTQTVTLEARPSAFDPERFVVAQKGSTVELPEGYLGGGVLGGLFSFRSESLDKAANALGQVAASIALTVNAQQALGQDLLGAVQGDLGFVEKFFTLSDPKAIPNERNSGGGSIDFSFLAPEMSAEGNFFTQIAASDYEVRFTSSTSYTVTRLSDKQVVVASGTPGVAETFDGLSLDFSGTHAAGDTYLLEPTREIARNIGVSQEIAGDVRRIAAAMPIRTNANATNTGAGHISAGEVLDGYTLANMPITLTYNNSGGSGEISVSSSGSPSILVNGVTPTLPWTYNSGDEITIDGFKFTITGTPADGDVFTLEPNAGGIADSRNIVKIGALQTALTMGNGTAAGGVATFQVGYAQLVSEIGTQTKTVLSNGKAQDTVLQQALEARSSVAGVNLDEEAANLIRYQQAYQAAARVMNTVSVLFDTLLSIGA